MPFIPKSIVASLMSGVGEAAREMVSHPRLKRELSDANAENMHLGTTIQGLKRKVREHEAEIARLRRLATDCELLGVDVKDGAIEVSARPKHWLVKAMVASLMDTIGDAPNFTQALIGGGEFPLFEVTVRRAEGKTPGQVVDALKDELEFARRIRDDAQKEADELSAYLEKLDTQIGEALEKINKFPGKPAGCPDRIDVACKLLVEQHSLIDDLVIALDAEAALQGFDPNEHEAYKKADAYLNPTTN